MEARSRIAPVLARFGVAVGAAAVLAGTLQAVPISRVQSIGTVTKDMTSGTTATFNVTSAVPVGSTVIVTVALGGAPTPPAIPSVSDTAGNTYTVTVNAGGSTVRTVVFWAPVTAALAVASTITITYATTPNAVLAATADEFSGIAAAFAFDQGAWFTNTNSTPNSGATGNTSQPNELVIGAIGDGSGILRPGSAKPLSALTPGIGYTQMGFPSINGSLTSVGVLAEYRIVGAAGSYSADAIGTSPDWTAVVVAFRGSTFPVQLQRFTVE